MTQNFAQIEAGIAAGIIVEEAATVEVSAKASPIGVAISGPYRRFQPLTLEAMVILAGGKVEPATERPKDGPDNRTDADKAKGACDYFDYGYDLDVRADVRAALLASQEGPEKAIAKAVKGMVENGGFDEAFAREMVIAQRRKAGLPV